MIERLQTLVSSDGRFKNMREALHRLAADHSTFSSRFKVFKYTFYGCGMICTCGKEYTKKKKDTQTAHHL